MRFIGGFFHAETLGRLPLAGLQTSAGAHGTPWQQFSVRKASRLFIVS
jgi:hypothetical protein